MKKYFSIIAVFSLIVFSSCNKDKDQIFVADFETQSDLDQWVINGDGNVELDNGSVSFTDINSCFHYKTEDLIEVKKNRSYQITIRSKHNPSQVGDPSYCVGNMMISVKQDSENLIMDGTKSSSNFEEQQYTFETKSASPIQLEFLIGTIHGAWIDYISIEKV